MNQSSYFTYLCVFSLLISAQSLSAQSLSFAQSVSNSNPSEEDPFEFVFDIACNSTTGDCQDVLITGYLPDALDYLNFSVPLPAGVGSANYNPTTRQYTITFNEGDGNDLSQGSSIQISLQAQFPVSTPVGRSVSNTATASGSNVSSQNSTASTSVSGGWTPGDFSEEKVGDGEQLPGGYQYYQVRAGNIGFDPIDNYELIDVLPSEITLDQMRTPHYPFVNHPGTIYYMRSDNPGVWVNWVNFNLNARQTRYVSDLGLPGGVKITQVRMTLGTVDGDGLYNPYRYIEGFESSLVLYGYIDSGLPNGYTVTNCADYTGSIYGSGITGQACHNMTINTSLSVDRPHGYIEFTDEYGGYINLANIGDTVMAAFTYYSDPFMSEDLLGGVMTVVLPPSMQYVPGSLTEAWTCTAYDGMVPVIQTGTLVDGRQYFRMVYDDSFGNEFNLESNGFWDGCGFNIDVYIPPGIAEGEHTINYYYAATGSDHADCGDIDTEGYLNGYSFTGTYCSAINYLQVVQSPGSAGIQSRKEVIGTLDSDYSQYPATGTTVPGGLSDYKITIKNPNATPIDNIVVIDILPHIGDTEVLDDSTPRSSQWQPNLAQAITAPAGVSVQYSTVTNPCRDELAGSNPTPFPSGCNAPNWNAVAPADITDVTALRFDLFGITLNQNDSIVLQWDMRAPVNAPTGGEISWNSFAYVAENASNGSQLLPAEPIKVGIQTQPGTVPIVGDFVWDDLNGNGLQDAGEPGIDGVRVGLYRDTDGDGLEEPYTDDTEYSWTITANGGQYIFSDFPTGDYYLVFSNFPSGYVETHKDVGSDDAIDSDGSITNMITYTGSTDTRNVDFGLYNGVLPPLTSCSSGLLTNNEFEAGFTSWADWGNTALTNDAYVGANAMQINGGQGGRGQWLPVNPGETYTLSFYAKMSGSEEAYGGINFKDVNNTTIYELNRRVYENTYEYHSVTVTAPANTVGMEVYGFKHAGAGAAYFDAFCLEFVNDVCPGGSKPDQDLDGVCQEYDIDDDNDGIPDEDEVICTGDIGGWVMWHHNNPVDSPVPDIYAPSLISSADNEVFGSGLGAYLDATLIKMTGVDQPNLSSAIADNDYLEYAFTTASNINSAHLEYFQHTKHGSTSGALPDNYGYDFTVLVSDDGFASSTIISDIVTVDPNIDPNYTNLYHEADDNYYVLHPNTEYTFRLYFYNKTTNPSVEAFYDDFMPWIEYCSIPADVDGDGIINAQDLDSDNDGLTDITESGHNGADSNNDGIIDAASSTGGINGLYDPLETVADIGILNYIISDSESLPDGTYDPYEIDSDGDGCYDTEEAAVNDPDNNGTAGNGIPTVDGAGRVTTITYSNPTTTNWQDPEVGVCLPEICTDGMDNDADGLIDCYDPDCDRIQITSLTVAPCTDGPLGDVSELSFDVAWSTPLTDTLVLDIYGQTKLIHPSSTSSPQTIRFNIPADGRTDTLRAYWGYNNTLCGEEHYFTAPVACSTDTFACNILYICGQEKPADGDAWDHGWIEYLNDHNGSATILPVLSKSVGAGLALFDPMNPSTPVTVDFSQYQIIIISATTEGSMTSALIDTLKNMTQNILVGNFELAQSFGLSASAGGYSFQDNLYTSNSSSSLIYDYNNYQPYYSNVFTRLTDYPSDADAYLWTGSGDQVALRNGVDVFYEKTDPLIGISMPHGSRQYFGYHMNELYGNAQNGEAIPSPEENWFHPARDLTPTGKIYFDNMILRLADGCGEVCCAKAVLNPHIMYYRRQ